MKRSPRPGGKHPAEDQLPDVAEPVGAARLRRTGRSPEAREWDVLAVALQEWGVKHLSYAHRLRTGVPRTARELFERLASSGDPRLNEAEIVLLLTHPELAAEARLAISSLPDALRGRAMRRYVAAAALQRMARTRIALSLGQQPDIPPAYLDELGLPSLDEDYGREALLALATDEEVRYGHPALRGYLAVLDLFLNEVRRIGWGQRAATS